MTNLNAFQKWKEFKGDKRQFCIQHYLSHSNMISIENMKDQYIRTIMTCGLGAGYTLNRSSRNTTVILTALGCALYPNFIFTRSDETLKKPVLNSLTFTESVQLHPSSNLHDRMTHHNCTWYSYYQMSRTETSGNTFLSLMDLNRLDMTRVLICVGTELISNHRRKTIESEKFGYSIECIGRTGTLIRLLGVVFKRIIETRLGLRKEKMSSQIETDKFEDESEHIFDTLFESDV